MRVRAISGWSALDAGARRTSTSRGVSRSQRRARGGRAAAVLGVGQLTVAREVDRAVGELGAAPVGPARDAPQLLALDAQAPAQDGALVDLAEALAEAPQALALDRAQRRAAVVAVAVQEADHAAFHQHRRDDVGAPAHDLPVGLPALRLPVGGGHHRRAAPAEQLALDQRVADLHRRVAQARERVSSASRVAPAVQRLATNQPSSIRLERRDRAPGAAAASAGARSMISLTGPASARGARRRRGRAPGHAAGQCALVDQLAVDPAQLGVIGIGVEGRRVSARWAASTSSALPSNAPATRSRSSPRSSSVPDLEQVGDHHPLLAHGQGGRHR